MRDAGAARETPRRERGGRPGGVATRAASRGFTLVEVLAALALLGLGAAALAATVGEGLRACEASRRRLVALALAESRIDAARNVDYDSLPLGSAVETAISGYPAFAARIDVTQALPGLKGIVVTVMYPEGEVRLAGYTGDI